jgi:hypothetical protein
MGADARQMMRALIAATVRSIKVGRPGQGWRRPKRFRLCIFAQFRNFGAIPPSPRMNLSAPRRD